MIHLAHPHFQHTLEHQEEGTPPRFAPFRGWRYAPSIPLEHVLTPPYDVIDEEARKGYVARHPYNIIRVILGDPSEEATTHPEAYEEAARLLRKWKHGGVLRQDPRPAFYLLRQRFRTPLGETRVRWGIIGRLLLRNWGEGILPHEQTFPAAKADRLALLKATRAHFSPIFALFSDEGGMVRELMAEVQRSRPDASFSDDEGVEHTLWVVQMPQMVERFQRALAARTFYVADGHHRYETALNFQRWMRKQYPDAPPGQPYDYAFLYVTPMEDPGVTILPTHRALSPALEVNREQVLNIVRRAYDVMPIKGDETLLRWIHTLRPGDSNLALVFPEGPGYKLHLRMDRAYVQEKLTAVPRPIAELAVYHLQAFVLGPAVGIGESPTEQKRVIRFLPDAKTLVQEVRAGRWSMVALVAATSLKQLQAIADARLVAPPKATYFYPKLPSGLVILSAGEDAEGHGED